MAISLGYLAAHLRNLEALLQTYRQINLNIQSVFLILGTFLMTRILETDAMRTAVFFEVILVSLTIFSNIVIWRFKQVIVARGRDVNWWQREIIKAEHGLPPEERRFTHFKIHQSQHSLSDEKTSRFLESENHVTWNEIQELLNAELDQIRKVINTYILRGIQFIWG
ncbi:MAG: hypothetical protein ACYC9O_21065, partial [Candidatus Latescibacterota bacterium]